MCSLDQISCKVSATNSSSDSSIITQIIRFITNEFGTDIIMLKNSICFIKNVVSKSS